MTISSSLFDGLGSTLTRIGSPIGKVLLFSPADDAVAYKKCIALAIDKGEVSFAVGSKFLSRLKISRVKKYPSSEGDFPNPAFLASSLALAMAELGVEKGSVTLSIPKAWAVIKTVEYPSSILENLSDVMAYELDRITPFTPETAYYDFKVLKEDQGRVFLLMAAARADLIDPYIRVIREKGFTFDQITISLLGMGSLCRYFHQSRQGLFIEIDNHQYEGVLSLSGFDLEVFSGAFPDDTDQKKCEQINGVIESLAPFSGQKAPWGETFINLKDKAPTLKESLKLQLRHPVRFLDEVDFGFGTLGVEQKKIPCSAVGGLWESLWTCSWGLNLLVKGLHRKPKPPWVITLLLVLTFGFLVGMYWTRPVEIEKERLQNLGKQIALKKVEVNKIESLKKEIEVVSGEIELVNNFKQTKPLHLDVLKELTLMLPKNAWLTRFRVFESQVSIEGYAPSATLLIPKLEGTKFFKKVEFAAPTLKDSRQNMDRFQIKMELKSQ